MKYKFSRFPKTIRQCAQFVVWKYVADPSNPEKSKKVPFDPKTGQPASVVRRKSWGTYDEAISCYRGGGYDGIGFVFSKSDPYVGIDLDKCRDKMTGEIDAWAQKIIDDLDSYAEVSPSGMGVHILVKGKLDGKGARKGKIEIYDQARYFTMTGDRVPVTPMKINSRPSQVNELYCTLSQRQKATTLTINKSGAAISTDIELIMQLSRGASNEKFCRLFSGDHSGYSSHSEADLALCSLLASVTNSPETIDRIFRDSKMIRPKWDKPCGDTTYGAVTVAKALRNPMSDLNTATKETSQYEIALKVIERIQRRNLLSTSGQLWLWDEGKGIWHIADDREIKKIIHQLAHQDRLTRNQVDSIFELLKTEVHTQYNPFNKGPERVINCLNGELHYENKEWLLKPHRRRSYFSQQIPIEYDEGASTERFKVFLQELFELDEDKREKVKLLREFMGYALTRSCEFERFLILVGQGANGKSVVLNLIKALLGSDNVAGVQPNQFENRFQLAHLQGKLANIITEIPEGAVIADAKLKALVSGELMTAEHKYGKPFDFEPYATMFFATNHLPHTRDFSSAFFRRAEILTFNRTFTSRDSDKNLIKKLRAELPGILNFALEGLRRLYRVGNFTEVACSVSAKRHWERTADQIATFVDEECELHPGWKAKTDDVYCRYRTWAEESGMKSALNKNNFSSRLVRLGCEHARGAKGVRMLLGIKLKPV